MIPEVPHTGFEEHYKARRQSGRWLTISSGTLLVLEPGWRDSRLPKSKEFGCDHPSETVPESTLIVRRQDIGLLLRLMNAVLRNPSCPSSV